MSHDPNPEHYHPATEYERFREKRDRRAQRDERPREPPSAPKIKLTNDARHGEDTDICPVRDEEGNCKESKKGKASQFFYCHTGLNYKGCGIYIEWRKRK